MIRVNRRRFVRVFVILIVLDAIAFGFVLMPRPTLTSQQWAFLEAQRPRFAETTSGTSLSISWCNDCLNFAVARRQFGGWETSSAQLLQLANLPAFLTAVVTFELLQFQPWGTSKLNSDLATFVLTAVVAFQCAAVAAAVSMSRARPEPPPK